MVSKELSTSNSSKTNASRKGVQRNYDRREETAPGTSAASLALRYGDCLRGTPSASSLSSRRVGAMATERALDLGAGSGRAGALKLPWSKDAESGTPSPTGLRVSG